MGQGRGGGLARLPSQTGPTEGRHSLIPQGAQEGQAHLQVVPPGRKKAGLAHSCTNQALAKGFEGA